MRAHRALRCPFQRWAFRLRVRAIPRVRRRFFLEGDMKQSDPPTITTRRTSRGTVIVTARGLSCCRSLKTDQQNEVLLAEN